MNKLLLFAVCTLLLTALISVSYAANEAWGGFYCTSSTQCQAGAACAPIDSQDEPDIFVCQYPSLPTWQTQGNLHGGYTQSNTNGSIPFTNGVLSYNTSSISGTFSLQPIIADLDADGKPDMITTHNNVISVYTMSGPNWELVDTLTVNGSINFTPYVGNLSFYSRTKSSKQQELFVVAGWQAYLIDFARDELRIVATTNISDVGLPSAMLNITSNIDCGVVNASYTFCSWKATNQIGSSGYIITVYPASNNQYPTNTRFKSTQQALDIAGQSFNISATRYSKNDVIVAFTSGLSTRPKVYFQSDNYSAVYAYDEFLGSLDSSFASSGMLTFGPTTAPFSGTPWYPKAIQLTALDSRNSGNQDICINLWDSVTYGGSNKDAMNNVSCYSATGAMQWSDQQFSGGNGGAETEVFPYGMVSYTNPSFTYPLICRLFPEDNNGINSDFFTLRCAQWSGSGASPSVLPLDSRNIGVPFHPSANNPWEIRNIQFTASPIIANDARPVLIYQNLLMIPNGSYNNYSWVRTNDIGISDNGLFISFGSDIIGNGKNALIRKNNTNIITYVGGAIPAENINYTPLYVNPFVTNGTWWGYYQTACANSTVTFHGRECDPSINNRCSYYNEPLHQERLGTTCGDTQNLTWGSWSPSNPSVSCSFSTTGAKTVRVYVADDRNPTDTSVYDEVEDINLLIATTSCNEISTFVNESRTSLINPENPTQPSNGGGGGNTPSSTCNEGFWECLGLGSALSRLGMAFAFIIGVNIIIMLLIGFLGGQMSFGGVMGVSLIAFLFTVGVGLIDWWVVVAFILVSIAIIALSKMFGTSGN